eukprot:NODE_129_length_18551_cov_0.317039.p11 type:complete len:138 gc:universal NODE_129_length_18551_cov_0.317039:12988-13401(+)
MQPATISVANPAVLKESHAETERRRRSQLNSSIEELKKATNSTEKNKVAVINASIRYIISLQSTTQSCSYQVMLLDQHIQHLYDTIQELEEMNMDLYNYCKKNNLDPHVLDKECARAKGYDLMECARSRMYTGKKEE